MFKDSVLSRKTSYASGERLASLIFHLWWSVVLHACGLFLTDRVKPSLWQRLCWGVNEELHGVLWLACNRVCNFQCTHRKAWWPLFLCAEKYHIYARKRMLNLMKQDSLVCMEYIFEHLVVLCLFMYYSLLCNFDPIIWSWTIWFRTIWSWTIRTLWSWTINNLEEYSKSNMLKDHTWNQHCTRSMSYAPGAVLISCSWSIFEINTAPGACLLYAPGAVLISNMVPEHIWLRYSSRLSMVQDHMVQDQSIGSKSHKSILFSIKTHAAQIASIHWKMKLQKCTVGRPGHLLCFNAELHCGKTRTSSLHQCHSGLRVTGISLIANFIIIPSKYGSNLNTWQMQHLTGCHSN